MNLKHNMHLVPQIVQDLAESALNETKHENERTNYIYRIEAIREYCNAVVTKYNTNKTINKSNTRFVR
jgi:hypothetical protein|tara:strand:+ start:395 stop:598 length:204 start_codon:yes stop_codon:yes gene_type:complete